MLKMTNPVGRANALLCKYKKAAVSGVFIAIALCGLAAFKDYGISYDDPHNRSFGASAFDHFISGLQGKDYSCSGNFCDINPAISAHGQIHSPAFEMALSFLEDVARLGDIHEIYLMRHLATFALFFISLIFFYLLCETYFNDWRYSLIGVLFLVLSPRIFADAFYNSVDIGALATSIIAVYWIISLLKRPAVGRAILAGVCCAFAIDTRVTATIFVAVGAVLLLRDISMKRFTQPADRRGFSRLVMSTIAFLLTTAIGTVFFWPYLWADPFLFFTAVQASASFGVWHTWNLYLSAPLRATDMPWSYNIVWIGITTPIAYLLLFFIGIAKLAAAAFRRLRAFAKASDFEIMTLAWLFLPLAAVVVEGTSMYNGWRHMFFIYPALIIIALIGLRAVFVLAAGKGRWLPMSVAALVGASLIATAYDMIETHPFENVYFNALAPSMTEPCAGFDKDYWGLSYRQGLEYILAHDQRQLIRVSFGDVPGSQNMEALPPQEASRFVAASTTQDADYRLLNYLRTMKSCEEHDISGDYHTIYVHDIPILSIEKLK